MGFADFAAGMLEHAAGTMANNYGKYSRDSRLDDESRAELAEKADRLRSFQDNVRRFRESNR